MTPPNTTAMALPAEPSVTRSDVEQVERALIDASTRVPVLIFYTSAVVWLLLATLLTLLTSLKLHAPGLLDSVSFLTWGRLKPAQMDVLLYGWASMVGIGTSIWLMARLSRTTLRHPLLLVAGAGFWNLGVFVGVIGILAGGSTGYEWLEFSPFAAIILFVAYSLVVSWAVLMFRFRRSESIYITQWYLMGAFLWFPWMYGAAQIMLFVAPVQGVMQAAVTWWFANNFLFLWLGAIVASTDLVATLPRQIGEALAASAGLAVHACPVAVPSFTVKQHWHARAHQDGANRWLRSVVASLFLQVGRR